MTRPPWRLKWTVSTMLLVIAPGAIGLSEESPAGETSRGLTKELLKMDLVSNLGILNHLEIFPSVNPFSFHRDTTS